MRKRLALSIVMVLGFATAAHSQQAGGSTQDRGLGSGTPGVSVGTSGTTYATPGAEQQPTIPGGGIPMGAATQDTSNLPGNPRSFNNGGSSNSR